MDTNHNPGQCPGNKGGERENKKEHPNSEGTVALLGSTEREQGSDGCGDVNTSENALDIVELLRVVRQKVAIQEKPGNTTEQGNTEEKNDRVEIWFTWEYRFNRKSNHTKDVHQTQDGFYSNHCSRDMAMWL